MRKRFWGISLAVSLILLAVSSTAIVAQRPRNRPATTAPPANDLKITYRQTTSGHSMESTTMLKGARERSEMKMGQGFDMINVTQCDLKRTLQISDSTKKYIITPMEAAPATANAGAVANQAPEPSRAGGVVTYTTNSVDTGERKEMFGFQARHIKRTITIESSPDACNPVKQRMETDGWYIDFSFGLNCETNAAPPMAQGGMTGGCRDRVRFNRTGAARMGYPLQETMTSYGPDGRVAYTSTKEVIDLSREPLDAALFDVPAGYTETTNAQELYVMPSMSGMTSQMSQPPSVENNPSSRLSTNVSKAPGVIRVGVIQINNKSGRPVSTDSLRGRLISEIQENHVEAIPLNAISLAEAEMEAKTKQCDFILFTDVSVLKSSAGKKLGGMFGRAVGVGGIDKTEAKVEFKLFAVGVSAPRLQSAATAKEEGDEASAGSALEQEAGQVAAEVRRSRG
jgi:hypothetical protein